MRREKRLPEKFSGSLFLILPKQVTTEQIPSATMVDHAIQPKYCLACREEFFR